MDTDQEHEEEKEKSLAKRACEGIVKPVQELKETVSRKRGPHKRTAIIIILLCVSIYAASVNEFYFTFYFLQVSRTLLTYRVIHRVVQLRSADMESVCSTALPSCSSQIYDIFGLSVKH